MLLNTFIHIPGIGPATEKKIWNSGIPEWGSISDIAKASMSPAKQKEIKSWSEKSLGQLENNNPVFFEKLLPAHQQYRLYREFRNQCAFLDIETTGLNDSDIITTIAIYDGQEIKYFVQGRNLHDVLNALEKYKILITYNGKSFDIPFIESYFNVKLPHAQIDLRYVLGHLGIKGGLKKCEKTVGIDREELDGVDGYFAVVLWNDYVRTGNEKALDTLLAYNIEDVINLELLMVKAYNLNLEGTPFEQSHRIEEPAKPKNPVKPDPRTIHTLLTQFR